MNQYQFIDALMERRASIANEIKETDLKAIIVIDLAIEFDMIRKFQEKYQVMIHAQQHDCTP